VDQSHRALGAAVRSGLRHRGSSDPIPLIPSVLRLALHRRVPASPRLWRFLEPAVLAVAVLALVVSGTGWLRGLPLLYVVERPLAGVGETRVRFSDGSSAVADVASRLSVVSAYAGGARLRLDDGHARLRFVGGSRGRFAVAAGPYTITAAAAEMDIRWSAARGTLSVVLGSGAVTTRGPLGDRTPVRLASGQSLMARSSDGSWQIGAARLPAAGTIATGVSAQAGRCSQRKAGAGSSGGEGGAEGTASVRLDGDGCLSYSRDTRGNRVPDFSSAGYRAGGVALPFVPRAPRVMVLQPGTSGDDTAALQGALDAVALLPPDARGLRGAVELAAGTFTLRGSVRLGVGGVVLRGQGQSGPGATVLRALGSARALVILGTEGRRALAPARYWVRDAYVPVGSHVLELDKVDDLQAGDDIVIRRSGLIFERRITSIEGNHITLDVPLTEALDREYSDATVARYSFPERVSEVGVERLAAQADFDHRSDLGDGIFVQVAAAMNGWVRQVRSEGFESGGVSMDESSRWFTIEDAVAFTQSLGGGEGWSRGFAMGGQQNLFLRCRSVGAREAMHVWMRSAGPNVVLDFVGLGQRSQLSVGRWSSGLLLDGVRVAVEKNVPNVPDEARGEGLGDGGAGSWSTGSAMFWNRTGSGESAARPESLYRAQLAERAGDSALAALSR
jgi:hypothetical protein